MDDLVLRESKVLSETIVFEQKWLGISHITFTVDDKIIENYESAYRTTKKKNKFPIDGVEIIPIIKRVNQLPEILFIANFRSPVGKFCLQFPAGLVESEDFEQNALRELQQETGYIADKILKTPIMAMHCDPWKSSQGGYLYIGIINEANPNHFKQQKLENSQNIRVHKFTLDADLLENINKFVTENNYAIQSKVWSLILGLSLNRFL